MIPNVEMSQVIAETVSEALRVSRSVIAYITVFILTAVLTLQFGGQAGAWGHLVSGLALLTATSALGAAVYRRLLHFPSGATILSGTRQLFCVGALVWIVIGILAFIAGLTLVLMSGVLVIASGYDPSGSDASDISGSMDALKASGAIWALYAALVAAFAILAWFLARLSLSGAATITSGKVKVFEAWGLTKGWVAPIMCLLVLFVGLPLFGTTALVGLLAQQTTQIAATTIGAGLIGLVLLLFFALSASLFRRLSV
ncbi:MAG: hypothetical protein Hens3KO_18640 [Henriciella sp.]